MTRDIIHRVNEPLEAVAVRGGQAALVTKRVVDIVIALGLLIILAGPFVLVALAVTLDSPGPLFFNRKRVGKDGREFVMYKVRTMVADAEDRLQQLQHRNAGGEHMIKIANDPRVTRVGRFLRASSIDELPQLLNVLKGDMSLIGPRPQAPNEVALYTTWQRDRLRMRPGITGLWQVRARHSPSFDEMMHWDMQYVGGWCLWLDLCVAWWTVTMLLDDIRDAMSGTPGPL
ncbi:MAG: sugar transferase [Chloroflexota bacterium]